jgi:hypothetical protein
MHCPSTVANATIAISTIGSFRPAGANEVTER